MVIRLSVGDFTVCGRRERAAPPLRGAKRIDNLRFSILSELQLSLICQSGADQRPATARNRGTAVGLLLRLFRETFAVHRLLSAAHMGYLRCHPLSPDSRFVRHCHPPGDLLLPFGQFTLCRTQRRAADLCSRNVSDTANRLGKTRKKKSSAVPL